MPQPMNHRLTYPDPDRPRELLQELCDFFAQFAEVSQICTFGSHASGEVDRWSDVDLMVLLPAGPQTYGGLVEQLCQYKPFLYYSVLVPYPQLPGHHVFLPVVFQDESVFHGLDLNFIARQEVQPAPAWERFGPMKMLYQANRLTRVAAQQNPEPLVSAFPGDTSTESPTEQRLYIAAHLTKLAIKKVLRGQPDTRELAALTEELATALDRHLPELKSPRGDLCGLARIYLEIAQALLL